jgi:hypothetical protein
MGRKRTHATRERPRPVSTQRASTTTGEPMRASHDMTNYILHLQRTIGNQAVGQFLRQSGHLPTQRRIAPTAPRPTSGPTVTVQRGLLESMSTFNRRIFGTDQSIAQFVDNKHKAKVGTVAPSVAGFDVVRKALEEEARLKAQRDTEIQTTGKSDINPDDALLVIPEEYRPRRITPSEKAVKANKQTFLDDDAMARAEKQRKVEDVHAVRVMKAQIGMELKGLSPTDLRAYALKAQFEALTELGGPADIAKLDPGAVQEKLQAATLKGKLKGLEAQDKTPWPEGELKKLKDERAAKKEEARKLKLALKIPKVKGLAAAKLKTVTAELEGLDSKIKKGPRNPERDVIEAELAKIKERKKQKAEIIEKLETASKDKKHDAETRDLLTQLIAWIKGKGAPEGAMKIVAVASTGVEVLGDQYKDVLLEMLNMKGKNEQNWANKLKDTNADTAGGVLGGIGTVATLGGTASSGVKTLTGSSVGKLTGNVFHNETVSGNSHMSGGRKIITQTGTAQDSADILGAAGGLLSLGNQITEFVSLAKALENGDPAEQQHAYNEIIDGVFSVGKNIYSLGSSATKLAGDFGGATLATELAGNILPIFDIASGALSLVQHGMELSEAASRIKGQAGRIKEATTEGAEHLALAMGQFKRQGAALVTSSSIAMAADSLKIVGGAITLSGIGAVVGQPVKLAGTVLSGVNKAGMALYAAFKTGTGQEARAADMLALPGSAEKLMSHDPKHASQALIREARGGSKVALDELASYGISKYVLDGSSDRALRKLMLSQLKLKEDGKTVGESVKQGVKGVGDWLHQDTSDQVKVLADIKNKLNYGGRSDRGRGWKAKMLIGGDPQTSTASLRRILTEMGPEGRKKFGITDEEYAATRTQEERELDKRPGMTISGPIGVGR